MKLREAQIEPARIEMIPLIDSIFLILVYFIYAFLSMSVHQGIPLELPKASSAVPIQTEDYAVSIAKDDRIYFNKRPVELGELKEILTGIQNRDSEMTPTIYIYADQDTRHGSVIGVLDLLRQIEWTKVYIETGVKQDDQ